MRALDEDTIDFSFYSSSSPLGQTTVSGDFTLHQSPWESCFLLLDLGNLCLLLDLL